MRLTYDLLKNFSYKELLKKGFSEKQITNKLRNFYYKESRALIINPEKGLTISKALQDLKKGRVRQGRTLPKPAINTLKKDLKNLNELSDIVDKINKNNKLSDNDAVSNYAKNIIDRYNKGQISAYDLHNAVYSYSNNIDMYIEKKYQTKQLTTITNFYNPMFNNTVHTYTNKEIRNMYE